jgi:hypothetical protein
MNLDHGFSLLDFRISLIKKQCDLKIHVLELWEHEKEQIHIWG